MSELPPEGTIQSSTKYQSVKDVEEGAAIETLLPKGKHAGKQLGRVWYREVKNFATRLRRIEDAESSVDHWFLHIGTALLGAGAGGAVGVALTRSELKLGGALALVGVVLAGFLMLFAYSRVEKQSVESVGHVRADIEEFLEPYDHETEETP